MIARKIFNSFTKQRRNRHVLLTEVKYQQFFVSNFSTSGNNDGKDKINDKPESESDRYTLLEEKLKLARTQEQNEINKSNAANTNNSSASASGHSTGRHNRFDVSATLHTAGQTYEDFEKMLMRRISESNQRRFRFKLVSSFIAILWITILFGARIRKLFTTQTADLARETLENESLKIQTQELAMAVVQTILNDKDIANRTAEFLQKAATTPETQQALLKLTIHILQHPDSLQELNKLVKKVIAELSTDKVLYIQN